MGGHGFEGVGGEGQVARGTDPVTSSLPHVEREARAEAARGGLLGVLGQARPDPGRTRPGGLRRSPPHGTWVVGVARDRLLGRPCFLSPSKNILVNSPIDEENPHPPRDPEDCQEGNEGENRVLPTTQKKKDNQAIKLTR